MLEEREAVDECSGSGGGGGVGGGGVEYARPLTLLLREDDAELDALSM